MKQHKFLTDMLAQAAVLQISSPPERKESSCNDIDLTFGNPDPSTFPLQEIQAIAQQYLTMSSLEYCANQGMYLVREAVASYIEQNRGIVLSPDAILVTNGAMEAIAIIAHAFIEPHDIVLIETPTYYRACYILQTFGAQLVPIRMESDGLNVQDLEQTLHKLSTAGKQAKILYTIPNHHNPTGTVLAQQKRETLIELRNKYGFLIVEDDVYTDLTYDGDVPQSLYSIGKGESIIQIGSFSKVLCPGIRTGWLMGDEYTVKLLAKLKMDGGSNPLASTITAYLVRTMDWNAHLYRLRQFYRSRRDAVVDALIGISPTIASWYRPTGGFFIWLQFTPSIRFTTLHQQMIDRQIYAMPGDHCTVKNTHQCNALRLAFSYQEESVLREGIARLQAAIQCSIS